jgi:hypothetical protein
MGHNVAPRVLAAIGLAVTILGAIGCPPGTGPTNTLSVQQGGGTLIDPASGERSYAPADHWTPAFGRLGAFLRRRHFDPDVLLAAERAGLVLFADSFDAFDPAAPKSWNVIGAPVLRVEADGSGGECLAIAAPPATGIHGIEHRLAGERVAGRVVRVHVATRIRSAARVRRLGAPELRWLVVNGDGRSHTVWLPLICRASPGWETQAFDTWFEPTVREARLQLVHINTMGACQIDDVTIERIDADQFTWASLPPQVRVRFARPSEPVVENLVANGNFEVGPKGFSVWTRRTWPGRGEYVTAHPWYFDSDAAIGQMALALPEGATPAAVTLGPHRLDPRTIADRYYLRFYAKASEPTEIAVEWRIAGTRPRMHVFRVGTDWAPYTHVLLTPVEQVRQPRAAAAVGELVFRPAGPTASKSVAYWLDGVSLTNANTAEPFTPPSPVEIGILGPAPDPTDLGELLPLDEPANIVVRTTNYAASQYTGTIAIDVIDAFGRPIWTKTTRPLIATDSTSEDSVVLRLGRGYYRVLATAWSGVAGASVRLSHDERALAVIDTSDSVPRGNFFGLAADAGRLSARTTQLGAGWVTFPIDLRWAAGADATSDAPFEGWHRAAQPAALQDLEITACVRGLPDNAAARHAAVKTWLETGGAQVTTAYLPDVDATRVGALDAPSALPRARAWLGLASQAPPALLLAAPTSERPPGAPPPTSAPTTHPATEPASARDGFAFQCLSGAILPEAAEDELEAWLRRREGIAGAAWVDIQVLGRAGSAYAGRPVVVTDPAAPVAVQIPTPDPLLSASRLVRGMLIRRLAGATQAAHSVYAFQPYETFLETPQNCLNEYDHAPRPALAAWDWMTTLLNDAVPIRWIDEPGDVRALVFAKADGRIAAAIWRPFGMTVEAMTLPGMAEPLRTYDLFGRPLPTDPQASDLRIEVDELVRYVVGYAGARDAMIAAIQSAQLTPGP